MSNAIYKLWWMAVAVAFAVSYEYFDMPVLLIATGCALYKFVLLDLREVVADGTLWAMGHYANLEEAEIEEAEVEIDDPLENQVLGSSLFADRMKREEDMG